MPEGKVMAKVPDLVYLNRGGGKHVTVAAALNALELPFIFAGREQFLRNITGVGVDDAPALQSVSYVNPRYDKTARQLLVGHLRDSATPKKDVQFWKGLVPPWAADVKKKLNAAGIPFSVELLLDPDVNISGSKPLFPKGVSPKSLFQATGFQKGETGYLRSLNVNELMLEVWPPYYRQFHRAAGAPAPYPQGLTFGAPYYDAATGTYLRSPLMSTPSYEAWAKAGQPD